MNIVLVHGILGFREKFGIEYFRGVVEHFSEKAHKVIAPILDPTRGIEYRGGQLRDQINAAFANRSMDQVQKTHIIAHSMGGLDSRFLLSPANPKPNNLPIRSLTTIGTPHFGSPIADAVDNPHTPQDIKDAIGAALANLDISLNGLRDLRTAECKAFSANHPNRPGVDYFCIAGVGRDALTKTWILFVPLHKFISLQTHEDNDGLVTLSSSQWGTPVGQWPADHIDEVGHNLPPIIPAVFHHLPKYDEILARLVTLN